MENTVATIDQAGALATLTSRAADYLAASMAANTNRAYQSDARQFAAWCEAAGVQALPASPATVALYLVGLADAGKKASTIDRARAAIRKAHELAGLDDPTHAAAVVQSLKGIRRTLGSAPTQKAPTLAADIRAMLHTLPDTMKGKRDRALLLLGFAGAFRRAELVAVTVEDINETAEGVTITLPRSKTDQEGRGIVKGILRGSNPDTCPVRALLVWLTAAGITSGPVFRAVDRHGNVKAPLTAQAVALVVKEAAGAAKLDPAKYAGHSLRAGLVTQAAKNKASVSDIMRQTGHKSVETVNRYIRKANIFEDNVSGMVGL